MTNPPEADDPISERITATLAAITARREEQRRRREQLAQRRSAGLDARVAAKFARLEAKQGPTCLVCWQPLPSGAQVDSHAHLMCAGEAE